MHEMHRDALAMGGKRAFRYLVRPPLCPCGQTDPTTELTLKIW